MISVVFYFVVICGETLMFKHSLWSPLVGSVHTFDSVIMNDSKESFELNHCNSLATQKHSPILFLF